MREIREEKEHNGIHKMLGTLLEHIEEVMGKIGLNETNGRY